MPPCCGCLFPGQDSLRTEVLFTEPRWVALPAAHPLATRDVVGFRELWDEPFVAAPTETDWWRDWWLAVGEREGHPVRIGAVTETGQPDDCLTAIANGEGIALAPASAARYYARPASPIGPSQASAPARSAPPGRPPPTPAPSSRTSSAAAGTTPLAQGDG
jgi:DNA-binding transcriptional LysR family regulator